MIIHDLKNIVVSEKQKNVSNIYIRNILKEYLQLYVLYYVYTSKLYGKKLIFTGGTCLRHFYGLERLSEDIDFDVEKRIDVKKLSEDIKDFFVHRQKYKDINVSLKQQNKQILLKFPLLHQLGLVSKSESDFLYVKMDISINPSKYYKVETTVKTKFGLNFVARHYDLPALFAGKLHAILTRRHLKGKENRVSIKGRDFYDLLWFLKKEVKPNIERLSDMLGQKLTVLSLKDMLQKRVKTFTSKYKDDFERDVIPLMESPNFIKTYFDNYYAEFLKYESIVFNDEIDLKVKCKKCNKSFKAGIKINSETYENLQITKNKHICPYCGTINICDKEDYIIT